jgi:hypothetical protein
MAEYLSRQDFANSAERRRQGARRSSMKDSSLSPEQAVLVVRDPAGRWYVFPREEAERWRLNEEQQGEANASLQESEVAGYDLGALGGLPPVVGFGLAAIVSPRDAASGLPTGKRQHKPFTITMPVDK